MRADKEAYLHDDINSRRSDTFKTGLMHARGHGALLNIHQNTQCLSKVHNALQKHSVHSVYTKHSKLERTQCTPN